VENIVKQLIDQRSRPALTTLAAIAVALVAAVAYAQGAPSPGKQGNSGGGMMMGQGASSAMHESMMKGMRDMQSMRTTGDIDRDFATMMRMHHQQAIEMAEQQLRDGKDPEMKAMSKRIIEDQRKEVKEFDDWLAKRVR
jgi:uncharacterized protein (DUF305 family)